MPWANGLDPTSEAYDIASCGHARIRVLAGPGTGKSFAMKRRVARLIEDEGVDPTRLLAVTFTRVAAEDLHRELRSLAIPGSEGLQARTLHSVAMSILMRAHVLPTLGRHPRPLNEFELQPLLEDLSPCFGRKHERDKLIDAYVAAWSRLQVDQPGAPQADRDRAFAHDLVQWLTLHRAMLIGEVVPMLHRYLSTNPLAPELHEFSHILVDEYQDLNRAEQEVVGFLGAEAEICIVGDDDQSIYSFKHAHPAGIREWLEAHGAEDFEIAECRRCPTTIVSMANALISCNRDRHPRCLVSKPENGPGEARIRAFHSVEAETAAVVADIERLLAAGVTPGEIIVLSQRKNFATPIYVALRQRNIPAKSYFAETPIHTRQAQERFAMLKLYLDNEDRVALRWLLGCYHNRWHAPTYARIMDHVRQYGDSPWATLSRLQQGTLRIPHTTTLVERFQSILDELESLREADDLDEFIEAWLPPLQATEATSLLAQAVAEHSQEADTPAALYEALQQEFTQPEIPLEVAEIRLMSFFKSKGLSSPCVFMIGCVQGLIPAQPDEGTSVAQALAQREEDRRKFYVAITRVKADPGHHRPGYLHISYPRTMSIADAMQNRITAANFRMGTAYLQASQFIAEMGPTAPPVLPG